MKQTSAPKRIKVGKNKFVTDFDNKTPLSGLSWDNCNGQYYYTFYKSDKDYISGKKTRKDFSFGSDYQEAVFRFKKFTDGRSSFILTVPAEIEVEQVVTKLLSTSQQDNLKDIANDLGVVDYIPPQSLIFQSENMSIADNVSIKNHIKTDKQYALSLLKQLLNDDELRIEAIRLLSLSHLLPQKYDTLPIKDVLLFYKDNPCDSQEKDKVEYAIKLFLSVTKKVNVNDLTEDDIADYYDYVVGSDYSPAYKKGLLTKIKTCFSYYLTGRKNRDKELVQDVHNKMLNIIKTSAAKPDESPKSISIELAKSILSLAIADEEIYLMCLLMLNCGYYPVDIAQLRKDMIRVDNGINYIIHRRSKTKGMYVRLNCLWAETYTLLQSQIAKTKGDYVFKSKTGDCYSEETISKKLNKLMKGLKHKTGEKVTAKHFRDTVASSLAFDVTNVNIIKITLGHATGNRDEFWKYVEAHPKAQQEAADILYQKFASAIKRG